MNSLQSRVGQLRVFSQQFTVQSAVCSRRTSTLRFGTRRKWCSPEAPTSTPNWRRRAVAATVRSFDGIMVPSLVSSANRSPHTRAVSLSNSARGTCDAMACTRAPRAEARAGVSASAAPAHISASTIGGNTTGSAARPPNRRAQTCSWLAADARSTSTSALVSITRPTDRPVTNRICPRCRGHRQNLDPASRRQTKPQAHAPTSSHPVRRQARCGRRVCRCARRVTTLAGNEPGQGSPPTFWPIPSRTPAFPYPYYT